MAGGQGCIIIREDGNAIVWKEKCESCGYVGPTQHHSSKPGSGTILNTGFYCPNCRRNQEVRIYG